MPFASSARTVASFAGCCPSYQASLLCALLLLLLDVAGDECICNMEMLKLCSVHCQLSVIYFVRGSKMVCNVLCQWFYHRQVFSFLFTALSLRRT